MDSVYNFEEDDFLKELEVTINHSDGFEATCTSQTNECQESYQTNKEICRTHEPQNIYRMNEETCRTNEA